MSYQVYRLRVFPCENNSHTVGRQETWQEERDKLFTTKEEAEEYIQIQTCIHVPEFTNIAHGLHGTEREKFLYAFCFTDDRYLKYRRFFIGRPNFKAMKAVLKTDGICVL